MTAGIKTLGRGGLALTLLLLAAIAAWATAPAKGRQIVGANTRWHVVDGGAWSIDHLLLWQMRVKLVAAAEASRAHRLAGYAPASAAAWARPIPDVGDYMVQVQGTLEGGRRVVALSGGCEDPPPDSIDLDKTFFAVADGGDCFFLATYDPGDGRYLRFDFNGPGL